ncbi:MAG: ABC transporter permease, partial [Deltaproteobacteria bacterium]
WAADERVEWTIPLSLGDSHRGFRVLGTNSDYWRHYRYGKERKLELKTGEFFDGLYDAVIGSVVAEKLKYQLNQQIVIAHGAGSAALFEHDDQPFRIVGILKPTGTPVDQTIHVSLEAIEAIHIGWEDGFPSTQKGKPATMNISELQPKSITAFLVRLSSRMQTFRVQGEINSFEKEPLSAILPGVTMQKLWQILGTFERTLMTVSALVVLSSLTSLISLLLATMNERRREIAILRSVGAGPQRIFVLLWIEATLLCFVGGLLGFVLQYAGLIAVEPIVKSQFGLQIFLDWPGEGEFLFFLLIMSIGMMLSLFPAWRAYRISLHDGLLPKI